MSIELLSPAGNLEKLKMALLYGADAAYLAGQRFGLRAFAGNFSEDEMAQAVALAHEQHAKVYVTANIFAHQKDLEGLEDYFQYLQELGVDAVIVSDPGIFSVLRRSCPAMPVHISTQANVTNAEAARFWESMGAKRIVLARELSLDEIKTIRQAVNLELETFIHGAMCMSYSGRCLLSDFMTGRAANRGECAQPCRWKYALMEETRPGEYFPIQEDDRGSYIFNSKDLCLLDELPALKDAGVNSFKIEGRMKSVHYVSTVTRVYRQALDAMKSNNYKTQREWWEELGKVSHRPYTKGFLYGQPGQELKVSYTRDYDFVGVVRDYLSASREALVEVRNRIKLGDFIELIGPRTPKTMTLVKGLINEEGQSMQEAPRPHQLVRIPVPSPVEHGDMIRRPKGLGEQSFIRLRIEPSHIFYLDIILEGFGHLGVPTTVDKDSGLMMIRTTPDTRGEVLKILATLPWPVQIAGED